MIRIVRMAVALLLIVVNVTVAFAWGGYELSGQVFSLVNSEYHRSVDPTVALYDTLKSMSSAKGASLEVGEINEGGVYSIKCLEGKLDLSGRNMKWSHVRRGLAKIEEVAAGCLAPQPLEEFGGFEPYFLGAMMNGLDPHSSLLTPKAYEELQVETRGEFEGVGMQVSVKDGVLTVISPFEGSPAASAGIKPGDRIIAIDGKPASEMSLLNAVMRIRGKRGSEVTLTIDRDSFDKPRDFRMMRKGIVVQSVKSVILAQGVGYMKLMQFQERSADDFQRALEQLRSKGAVALVLDLRNNSGGLLRSSVDIASTLLRPDSLVVTVKGRAGDEMEYRSSDNSIAPDMPVVILVNKGSASASEILTAALRESNRAIILGGQTFGKGSVQNVMQLREGYGLKITTAMYMTPEGRSIDEIGIAPDIVFNTAEELDYSTAPQDEQLVKYATTFLRASISGGKYRQMAASRNVAGMLDSTKSSVLASISFKEPSGNATLEAGEKGTLSIKLINKGKGAAYNIKAIPTATSEAASALKLSQSEVIIGTVLPTGEANASFKIEATADREACVSGKADLLLYFKEANSMPINKVEISIPVACGVQ